MKFTSIALLATLTSTCFAIPLRLLPLDTFLPLDRPLAPGPHHVQPSLLLPAHHPIEGEVATSGGGIGILPLGLKEELRKLAHMHHEGAIRFPLIMDINGGPRRGDARISSDQMTVIEPDGSRTVVIHHFHGDASRPVAPRPQDMHRLRETVSLRIDEALDALKPEEAAFLAFVFGAGLGSLFGILFRITRLLVQRRRNRAAKASSTTAASPPDYYHSLKPEFAPTAGSLLDRKLAEKEGQAGEIAPIMAEQQDGETKDMEKQ